MADTLKDIPEFFETELGESIIARTDALGTFRFFFLHSFNFRNQKTKHSSVGSFRELGPPDLCHIIKVNAKPGVKEVIHIN